jgi:hypothetical protein
MSEACSAALQEDLPVQRFDDDEPRMQVRPAVMPYISGGVALLEDPHPGPTSKLHSDVVEHVTK